MPTNTIEISPEIITVSLQLFFYLFLIFFTLYSSFLLYHWVTYGAEKKHSYIAAIIYLTGAAPFLATMAIIAFL